MPPFEFDIDRVGPLPSTFSEDVDIHSDNGIDCGVLKNLLSRCEEERIGADLSRELRALLQRATEFSRNAHAAQHHHALTSRAVDGSIRLVLAELLDQVALVLDLEGNQRHVVSALTRFSISQALNYFNRLEAMIRGADHDKLKPFLDEFSRQREPSLPFRLSLTSRALAFEFVAGQVDTALLPSSDERSLGIRVTATPYLLIKTDAVVGENNILQKYSNCMVKVDKCSHKKLFTSSGSGIMGEAMVRIYVNPGKEVKIPKEGQVWGQAGVHEKLHLIQARA
jgi:hypothetical protein